MGEVAKQSAVSLVHARVYRLGPLPLRPPESLRSSWSSRFMDSRRFIKFASSLYRGDRPWTFRGAVGSTSELYAPQYREAVHHHRRPAPAKPFFPGLGSLVLLDRDMFNDHPGTLALFGHRDLRIAAFAGDGDDEGSTPDQHAVDAPKNYEAFLEDRRMCNVYFEIARPLYLRQKKGPGTAKVFVHIYPAGFIVVLIAVSLTPLETGSLSDAITESRPWRGKTIWKSRLGEGTLGALVENVVTRLEHGFYSNGNRFHGSGEWHTTVRLSVPDESYRPDDVVANLGYRGAYESVEKSGWSISYIVAAGRQVAAVSVRDDRYSRSWASHLLWRLVAVNEMLAIKAEAYSAYRSFFRAQRAALLMNYRNEVKAEPYDPAVYRYLDALDSYTRGFPPMYRFLYSVFANARHFDVLRDKTRHAFEKWTEGIKRHAGQAGEPGTPLLNQFPHPAPATSHSSGSPAMATTEQAKTWDVFISYASEDKAAVARPIAQALAEHGITVWFDEATLCLGDSLRRSIDQGLASSRYGVVIISHNFLAKDWPQRELDGLVARELKGRRVILPVWYEIEAEELAKYSPLLADRVGAKFTDGLESVVRRIVEAVWR